MQILLYLILRRKIVISAKTHLYHTDNNPYEGFKLHGDIDSVYLNEELMWCRMEK